MSAYNRLNYAAFKRPREDSDNPLKGYKELITRKESYDVTNMEFSPSHRSQYAITLTSGVKVYDIETEKLVTHLPKLEHHAYGATFRYDGQMLAMGSEKGDVLIHAPSTKKRNPIRVLTGHSKTTTRMRFLGGDQSLVSFSDDTTVKLWDVSNESLLSTFKGHKEAVRAGDVNILHPDLILSGSRDGTVKLWDRREESPVFSFEHKSEVSKVLIYPDGNKFVSAGDVYVNFWDLRSRSLVAQCVEHSAPISDLSFFHNKEYILSASEDKMVKIFNGITHECVGMRKFAAPLTSIAVSDKYWVVGMSGYCHQVLQNNQLAPPQPKKSKRRNERLSKRTFGMDNEQVEEEDAELHKIDQAVRTYNYNKAFKIALSPHTVMYRKMALFRHLREHNSWRAAVLRLSPDLLKGVLDLIGKNMGDPAYHDEVMYAQDTILDTLKNDPKMRKMLNRHIQVTVPIRKHIKQNYVESMELVGLAKLLLEPMKEKLNLKAKMA